MTFRSNKFKDFYKNIIKDKTYNWHLRILFQKEILKKIQKTARNIF